MLFFDIRKLLSSRIILCKLFYFKKHKNHYFSILRIQDFTQHIMSTTLHNPIHANCLLLAWRRKISKSFIIKSARNYATAQYFEQFKAYLDLKFYF